MITIDTLKKTSLREIRAKSYQDFKKILDLYDQWDVAAKDKDFYNCEHIEYQIDKIHKRNGVTEN